MPNGTTDDAAKCPPWCPGPTGGRLGRRARGGQRRQWPAQPPSRTRGACLGVGVEPAVTGGTQPTQPWKRPVDLNCCWRALQSCWRQGSLLLACDSASCLRRLLPHCPGSPQASKEALRVALSCLLAPALLLSRGRRHRRKARQGCIHSSFIHHQPLNRGQLRLPASTT